MTQPALLKSLQHAVNELEGCLDDFWCLSEHGIIQIHEEVKALRKQMQRLEYRAKGLAITRTYIPKDMGLKCKWASKRHTREVSLEWQYCFDWNDKVTFAVITTKDGYERRLEVTISVPDTPDMVTCITDNSGFYGTFHSYESMKTELDDAGRGSLYEPMRACLEVIFDVVRSESGFNLITYPDS